MKILALIGSPRKGSNTDTLVDKILEGSRSNGHEDEKLYLYNYEINPCTDCRSCKSGFFVCSLEDDMLEIYPKMENADLIIFATPIYWYGPTAVMKLLIDRMRPFIANGKLKAKKAVVVIPSEEGPKACGPLMEMFKMSFEYLGMNFAGEILATAYERGEIKNKPEELQKAFEFGKSL